MAILYVCITNPHAKIQGKNINSFHCMLMAKAALLAAGFIDSIVSDFIILGIKLD